MRLVSVEPLCDHDVEGAVEKDGLRVRFTAFPGAEFFIV